MRPTAMEPCLLCGSSSWVRHFRQGGTSGDRKRERAVYRITLGERHLAGELCRCRACGMVTLPVQARPSVSYVDGADPHYMEHAESRIANARRLLALLPSGGRLLEVGCAVGFLLVAAREMGFTVEGVEPSRWASEQARFRFGLTVHTSHLEDAPLLPGQYDVVVMADVIEHLGDPRAGVRAANRLLRKGGRLLVLTPDIGSVTARVAGKWWWGILDDHFSYFTRKTLTRLLQEEGFSVERTIAFSRSFPLSHWVFKLAPYSPALHRAAQGLIRSLRLANRNVRLNLGDQMVCMARKS